MSEELIKGTLLVTKKKAVRLKFVNKNGKNAEIAAHDDLLSSELATTARDELSGVEVEFILDGPNKAMKGPPR